MEKKRILILSPHTDDAELGCGATISKFISENHSIYWLVFSTAEDSLPHGLPKDTLAKEFKKVTKAFGLKANQYEILNYRVRYLHEKRQEILEKLIQVKNSFQPTLVIGPSIQDLHQDHIIVANEMMRAFKSSASIISYELPWNHLTFNTQLLVRLKRKHIHKKFMILSNYKSQFLKNRNYFSKEYIFGIATTRGIQANSDYAEAFEIIRWIE